MSNTAKNILYFGLGALSSLYVAGTYIHSKELSKTLEPVSSDFEKIVENTKPAIEIGDDGKIETYNYHGKLDKPLAAKNKFAKDNGAFALDWRAHPATTYNKANASTPGPIAYNPFKWNDKINETAIRDYQKNNKYRTRK